MRLKPIDPKESVPLRDKDAHRPKGSPSNGKLKDLLEEESARLAKLQRVFYADARHALLIVLQGRDASGKDGTIRHVFSAVNPQGCQVTSFKAPSDIERRHDFLWRVHQAAPALGIIGIFNRSHYEDVLVERVRNGMPKRIYSARCDQINDFEEMLAANGTVILKFFLHVSRDEQRTRLEARLSDKTKNWKFQAGDLDDRAMWDEYTKAYEDVLTKCSTKPAPWFLVPADDEKLRSWLVARTITDALKKLDLRYPPPEPGISKIEVR